MTKDFEADALHYLLDDMDSGQRLAFEGQVARFPAARIALEQCADALKALRRQALELPFFERSVDAEVGRVMQLPGKILRRQLYTGMHKVRQFIALS